MVVVHGHVERGYEPVRAAFAANFDRYADVGAACCVHVQGRPVVDLWGGTADPGTGQPYGPDTLQLVFSATKGATAVCALQLVERGQLDLDAPVARYWPEFAQAGKQDITVRSVLSHRSGLVAVDAELTLAEVLAWEPVIDALARQRPAWPPGSTHGYHALTFGWLVGELVRRVTGRSLGRYFADEVAEPLGLDFWVGLPPEQEARVARLIPYPEPTDADAVALMAAFLAPDSLSGRALQGPGLVFTDLEAFNRRDVHAAEIPSNNGITTARGLSRLYAGLVGEVDGVRVLGPEMVDQARTVASSGADAILGLDTAYGLGFQLPSSVFPAVGAGGFGHVGAGGSLGCADPELGMGFGYVMNAMQQHLGGDPRPAALVDAVRRAAAGEG